MPVDEGCPRSMALAHTHLADPNMPQIHGTFPELAPRLLFGISLDYQKRRYHDNIVMVYLYHHTIYIYIYIYILYHAMCDIYIYIYMYYCIKIGHKFKKDMETSRLWMSPSEAPTNFSLDSIRTSLLGRSGRMTTAKKNMKVSTIKSIPLNLFNKTWAAWNWNCSLYRT